LSCVIYNYSKNDLPYIGFSAEQIRLLSDLGASIDIDHYFISPEEKKYH